MFQIQRLNDAGQWGPWGLGHGCTNEDATFATEAEASRALAELLAVWGPESDPDRIRVVEI